MRPIKLEIEGLHSFLTKQVIDFTSLSSQGIFGIFGQTGSGKSTILDAMVLALYGKVQRSKTNSDFINLKSKKAEISFSFSFCESGKTKEYLVKRTFKRKAKNPNEVDQIVELFEVGAFGIRQVLEGASKVDKFIIELLGMSETEFLKCVALPQGEFSAFLRSKPNERVAIIGNIFDLNKYGDRLWEKVKIRTEQHEKELAVLEGKLTVLGDVDGAVLTDKKNKLGELDNKLQEKVKELELLTKTEKEEREVVSLGKERADVQQKIEECKQVEQSISFKKDALNKSKKLIENKFLLDRESELQVKILKEKDDIYTAAERIKAETIRHDEFKANTSEELVVLKSEIEELIKRLENIKALEPVEKELLKSTKESENTKHELDVVKSKIENLTKKLSAKKIDKSIAQDNLSKVSEEVSKLKEELNGFEVLLSYKLLSKFNTELKGYQEFAENKHADAVIMLSNSIENLDVLKNKEKEVCESIKILQSKYNLKPSVKEELLFSEYEKKCVEINKFIEFKLKINEHESLQLGYVREVQQLKKRKEKLVNEKVSIDLKYKEVLEDIVKLESKKNQLISEKNEAVTQNSLFKIIKETKIGSECPVCRSEVLQKNTAEVLDLMVIDNAIESYQTNIDLKLEKKEGIVYKIARIMSSMEDVEERIVQLESEIDKIREKLQSEFLRYVGEGVADYSERLDAIENKLNLELETLISDYKKEKLLFGELAKIKEDYVKQSSLNVFAGEEAKIFAELLNSLSESITKRDIEMLGILSQEENLSLKLEEMDKINKLMELKLAEREEINQSVLNLSDELLVLETELARLLEQQRNYLELIDGLEETIKEKQLKISSLVSGSVVDSVKIIEVDIANKKYRVEELESLIKEQQESINEAKLQLNTQIAENKAHIEEHAKLATSIASLLTVLSLSSVEDARVYLINDKDVVELENSIVTYETKYRHFLTRLEELDKKLEGRISGGAILEQLAIQVLEVQEKITEIKEETTKLKLEINIMEEKFAQVESIKKELEVVDKKYTTAKELYSVLKGKALLEYIAEEFIDDISYMASERLQVLMDGRYELKYENKEFYVVDNFNDATKRPVSTLSGGEMFVVSLALALSISNAISSRSNKAIDFFFLDEGFGTLDKEYCEYIVDSLVKLSNNNLVVGLISHIPELQERISEKLIVSKNANGSIVKHVSDL